MPSDKPLLTKSRFMAGLQCPKRLWRQCHAPAEATSGGSQEIRFGNQVGLLARMLFKDGVLVTRDDGLRAAAAKTKALLIDQFIPAIFEATIGGGRLLAQVDVLERLPRGRWRLCEVKSSGEVKDEHLNDVAFQYLIASDAGLEITRIEIIHVNKAYHLDLDGLSPGQLLTRADVTLEAKKRARQLRGKIDECLAVLARRSSPDVDPWSHCHSPYSCEFWSDCTAGKPNDWIFYLPHLGPKREAALRELGVVSISAIPDDVALTSGQAIIRDAHRLEKPYVSIELKKALRSFGPPALYLDFETMSPAVPIYAGTSPYQRIPFQWSLHCKGLDGTLEHFEFLADGRVDPREAFVDSLLDSVGGARLPIIVYSSFEASTLTQLAEALPKRARAIRRVIGRLRDLLDVVRKYVYHPRFGCSYSIKSVGPTLAPAVRYDDLERVADGAAAARVFEQLATGGLGEERVAWRAALLEYCKRDTLAMVEVHAQLLDTASGRPLVAP